MYSVIIVIVALVLGFICMGISEENEDEWNLFGSFFISVGHLALLILMFGTVCLYVEQSNDVRTAADTTKMEIIFTLKAEESQAKLMRHVAENYPEYAKGSCWRKLLENMSNETSFEEVAVHLVKHPGMRLNIKTVRLILAVKQQLLSLRSDIRAQKTLRDEMLKNIRSRKANRFFLAFLYPTGDL